MDHADVHIDEALVRALLHEQHPDLAGLGLREVAGGWTTGCGASGRNWPCACRARRVPRPCCAPSSGCCPLLGLPLPVPVPVRAGEPSARFPQDLDCRAMGSRRTGRPHLRSAAPRRPRPSFLRALHRPAPSEAPANPDRGVPLGSARAPRSRQRWFPLVAASNATSDVRHIWEQAVEAPAVAGPHRYGFTVIFIPRMSSSPAGTLSGVLDFGEHVRRRSGDGSRGCLAATARWHGSTVLRRVRVRADDATIRRAGGWAVLRAVGLIGIGQNWERGLPGGKQTWGPAGWAALEASCPPAEPGGRQDLASG